MEFGVAVIGCGDLGTSHADVWSSRPDAKVLTVFDPQGDRGKALAEKHNARACTSYQQAIDSDVVNVVSVCTPTCMHSEISCYAAAGGRHVLSEKPVALTLEQADAMISAAAAHNVQVAVSYQFRGAPSCRRYRSLFLDGQFGGPLFARFVDIREVRPKLAMHRESMNGGPVIDMGGHYFDLMRFITDAEPLRVSASGHVFGQGKQRLSGIDDLAVDAAEVLVEFSHGHVLSTNINWGMPEGFPEALLHFGG